MANKTFTLDEIIKCWEKSDKGTNQKIKNAFFMNLGTHYAERNKKEGDKLPSRIITSNGTSFKTV
jgi:hypothetical protein